ncbi:hypothetical protein DXG03_000691 [Asterophora parasitica]|uniref:C2H2-type domain-containing protein n=1 Tax=Asterophora parasitica TaxID=117018 RepID=A0A9P7G690_9AGAR|nr:hypothetical protein DXG03_000691 [Asterophora parasitica]
MKKRITPKKKTVVTGVWPCKINGCNKQFAREADLKRHQRTTKLHSMPGLHNGVVVEPDHDPKDDADDDGSSGSQSNSRSATPSAKGKERAPPPLVSNVRYPVQPTRAGPSSYYRQHTLTSTGRKQSVPSMTSPIAESYVPRQPIVDSHHAQIGLPTSATRLNAATHWGYPHPWPDGASHQMTYQQMYYYRPNGVHPSAHPPSPEDSNQQQAAPKGSPSVAQGRSLPMLRPPQQSPQEIKLPAVNTCTTITTGSSMTAVESSLDASESATLTEEQVLVITQAAMKAVFEAEAERSSAESGAGSSSSPSYSESGRLSTEVPHDEDDESSQNLASEEKSRAIHGYGQPLERPEPMEHMLTEDGEPMLNPAELLTQESLASPPPS